MIEFDKYTTFLCVSDECETDRIFVFSLRPAIILLTLFKLILTLQARVRFGFGAGDPMRRSCVSRVQNAGEIAFWPGPAQPSAEIVRVECAKCR